MRIKNHFHINGFALSLALEKKLGTTLNRPTLLPDWLLKVIWWNYRLTTQMRLVLRKNQRYSSFEFLLICLPEQTLLGHSRNTPLEGNKCKNTPGRVSAKFTSLNNHQWPRLLCQRDVQTHYSSFPWTQMPWHSIVDKKKTPMSQQELSLSQYQHKHSPHCSSYISWDNAWENFLKHPGISSCVINWFILMTWMLIRQYYLLEKVDVGHYCSLKD